MSSTLPQAQIEQVRERFAQFLRERGQRQTPERFAVLEALYATSDHVEADTLFARLKAEGTRVSRATVYNTLDLLIESDLAVKHQFGQHQARYERAFAYWQHDHLVCLACGEILEFCDPRLQAIQDTISDIYDFRVARHALTIYGYCAKPACRDAAEAAASAGVAAPALPA